MNVPARPPVIIRAPEREKSKESKMDSSLGSGMDQKVADKLSSASRRKPDFVIYTNTGVCLHSEDLVTVAHKRGLNFHKIDVSQTTPPSWLPGTPSVSREGNVYCGDAAFAFVEGFPIPEPGDEPGEPKQARGGDKDTVGCSIKAAFAPPKEVEVDESQFNISTEDMMQKLLAGRR